MARQGDALRLMLATIAAMREASYSHDDVLDLVKEAWEHVERTDQRPHAFGSCTNCNRLIIEWSVDQWSVLVREPCPKYGEPCEQQTHGAELTIAFHG